MLVLYVSAPRRGPVGGLSWFCGARLRFCADARRDEQGRWEAWDPVASKREKPWLCPHDASPLIAAALLQAHSTLAAGSSTRLRRAVLGESKTHK